MTDRENLIAMLERMGLTRTEGDPGYREYSATATLILIGEGDGYNGFYAKFEFDEQGNATSHGLWE